MAAHEEAERRALDGELALLEAAWRQAEEIASIADDLIVSDDTRRRLAEIRGDSDAKR
jgi:polyribonucleotide nucleotidyltransferase